MCVRVCKADISRRSGVELFDRSARRCLADPVVCWPSVASPVCCPSLLGIRCGRTRVEAFFATVTLSPSVPLDQRHTPLLGASQSVSECVCCWINLVHRLQFPHLRSCCSVNVGVVGSLFYADIYRECFLCFSVVVVFVLFFHHLVLVT